jgi:Ca2+-binding EF-hand superfamily protein
MKKLSTLGSVLLILSCPAWAELDESELAAFLSLDSNGDREISYEEADGHQDLLEQFATLDLDGNGALSESEFDLYVAS